MFLLVEAEFLLWVPVGAKVGPGEGLVGGWADGGMLGLQMQLVLGLVEGRVDGQLEGSMLCVQRTLDVLEAVDDGRWIVGPVGGRWVVVYMVAEA